MQTQLGALTMTTMSDDSDKSDDKSMSPNDKVDDICRDFLRNVCKRGKRCKYRHPDPFEAKELGRKHEYTFCHDFQNAGCRRANCKFIHCTREEEDYYKQTGQLPVRLQQAAALGVVPNELPLLKGEVPICKDYLKGECKRAGRCKYRHLTAAEYEYELRRSDQRSKPETNNDTRLIHDTTYNGNGTEYDLYECSQGVKRKRLTFDDFDACSCNGFKKIATPADYRLLEEENAMLRRKVEELKKQVSDLTAANEVLLEQNARYRASKANGLTTLTLSPPVVTVSQVVTPTVTPAPTVAPPAIARAPVPAPGPPITHLSSTLPLTLNAASATELVVSTQQPFQPRLAEPDIGQQASMAPAGAAINPPGSMNLTNIVPVSLPVSLSVDPLPPPLSMAVTSLTQRQPQPQPLQPAPGVSLAQSSLAQTIISAPTTPMVSYPIVSQTATCHNPLPNSMPTSSLTQ